MTRSPANVAAQAGARTRLAAVRLGRGLRQEDLAAAIGRIFSASEVLRPKSAPDLFLHAAAETGVDPSRCLVIEDMSELPRLLEGWMK